MNNQEIRKPRSAAVSVKIQPNTYGTLRKTQEELSSSMGGVKLSLSQTIAIVVIEYGIAQAAKQREGVMKVGDRWIGTSNVTPERVIAVLRREMGEDAWREFEAEEAERTAAAVFSMDEIEQREAAIRQELDEDAAAEAAWLVIQEEWAGQLEAQEREWAEDEGRDPAELTRIDVMGKR